MTFGSLFAGIGGIDLGLERAGMVCKWQVEIDPFCQKVLTKHWPELPKYGDITKLNGSELERVDLICGGFPCQDLSVAGKRAGIDGERSGLWREYSRLLGVLRPRFVLIENVPGMLANESMRRVLGDLSALRYDAEWESIPAGIFGFPHVRDRVVLVAYNREARIQRVFPKTLQGIETLSRGENGRRAEDLRKRSAVHQSLVRRGGDGVPYPVDRVGALGNAVVPQVAEWVGRRIVEAL